MGSIVNDLLIVMGGVRIKFSSGIGATPPTRIYFASPIFKVSFLTYKNVNVLYVREHASEKKGASSSGILA